LYECTPYHGSHTVYGCHYLSVWVDIYVIAQCLKGKYTVYIVRFWLIFQQSIHVVHLNSTVDDLIQFVVIENVLIHFE